MCTDSGAQPPAPQAVQAFLFPALLWTGARKAQLLPVPTPAPALHELRPRSLGAARHQGGIAGATATVPTHVAQHKRCMSLGSLRRQCTLSVLTDPPQAQHFLSLRGSNAPVVPGRPAQPLQMTDPWSPTSDNGGPGDSSSGAGNPHGVSCGSWGSTGGVASGSGGPGGPRPPPPTEPPPRLMDSASQLFFTLEERLNHLDRCMLDQAHALSFYQHLMQGIRDVEHQHHQESVQAVQRSSSSITDLVHRVDMIEDRVRTYIAQIDPVLAEMRQNIDDLAQGFLAHQNTFDGLVRRVEALEHAKPLAAGSSRDDHEQEDVPVRVLFRSAT